MDKIEQIINGSVDMHVHPGPDARVQRRCDGLEIAQQAIGMGMRAVVSKNHEYGTAPMVNIINKVVGYPILIGSICLNVEEGGINPWAVEASVNMGAKIVWMPTFSSPNHLKVRGINDPGITLFDENGNLLPVVDDILDIIRSKNIILATGHISIPEVFALVDRANSKGVEKIVITHPLWPKLENITIPQQLELNKKGAIIEHCFSHTLPLMGGLDAMKITEAVKALGAENCILSTDLGQLFNPAPAEGMRMMIASMLQYDLSEEELVMMVKTNPVRLLDLDQ
ncbi:DUF6282 family protein [Chloroflexota bacterium]